MHLARVIRFVRRDPKPYLALCAGPLLVFGWGALIRWPDLVWLVLAVGTVALATTMYRVIGRKLRLYFIIGPLFVLGLVLLVMWPAALWIVFGWGSIFFVVTMHATMAVASILCFFMLGQSFWPSSFSERLADFVRCAAFFAITYLLPITASLVGLWVFPGILGVDHHDPQIYRATEVALVLPLCALVGAFVMGLIFGLFQISFPNLWSRLKLDKWR